MCKIICGKFVAIISGLAILLCSCSEPKPKSQLELNFEKITIGQSMDEVITLLGEPDSKTLEPDDSALLSDDESVLQSDDGSLNAPRGSPIHMWSYDDGSATYGIWFTTNGVATDPQDVVFGTMNISVGPWTEIK